jgi:tRNA (mo5U34)-methyltransferase
MTATDETMDSATTEETVWYHTVDLPAGPTPGLYDLRKVVGKLPWPDLRGLRCLDVGSRNGFLAFEMERRGAAEVVALDIDDPADIDFAAYRPRHGFDQQDLDNGSRAYELAARALRSKVRRHALSVYRLTPDAVGTFDFAIIGTLLLHLRDPVGALGSLRKVVTGNLIVNEAVTPSLDLFRRRPVAEALMYPGMPFWWLANPSGLRTMVAAGGFEVVDTGGPYLLPNGAGAPKRTLRDCFTMPVRDIPRNLVKLRGDPHYWLLARPGREE